MELFALLAALLVIGVPIASVAALARTANLKSEIERLQRDLTRLNRQVSRLAASDRDGRSGSTEAAPAGAYEAEAEPEGTEVDSSASAGAPGGKKSAYYDPESALASRVREREARGTSADAMESALEFSEPLEPPEPAREPEPEPEATAEPEPTVEAASAADPTADPTTARSPLDLETVIGTTWLLRAGLGILAIALALFARTVAPQLPNFAKVGLAYAGSIAFFGFGRIFESRLERFARPVMAGGLAFGFFVAFAAYFVPGMRSVPMSVSIGWMLVSMFTVLVAAERWDSEPTAILAIILGHVAAQVSSSAADWSSLVLIAFLGATALVLLLRHRWVSLGLLAAAGSYGAHFLWFTVDQARALSGDQSFLLHLGFLTSYYMIFLVADVLWWRRHQNDVAEGEKEVGKRRWARALGPTNLALYVGLTTVVYFETGASVDHIEWYYLSLGVLQAVLAWMYGGVNHEDSVFYPVFGTVLWTVGLFAALDALVLNLVLASQALLLLLVAHRTGMRVLYYVAQGAMAVTFVHYIVYPPPVTVTAPLFLGGLGVASVYFVKAALEESWYGAASLVAPAHAVLGGLVVLREAFGYFGSDPGLGLFVFGAQLAILAGAAALSSATILIGLTTIAAGSPFLVGSVSADAHWASLTLLVGLAISASLVVHTLWERWTEGAKEAAYWQSHAIGLMALFGGFTVATGLGVGRPLYLMWMLLPASLVVFHYASERRQAAVSGADDGPAGAAVGLSLLSFIAISALVIVLIERTIEPRMEQPFWVATWVMLAGVGAGITRSRGVFATAYTLLFGGYLLFLLGGGDAIGLVATTGPFHPALESWWLAPCLVAVALLLAIGTDRAMGMEATGARLTTDRPAQLVVTLVPYLMGLGVAGLAANAQWPEGWGVLLPGLFAIGLIGLAQRLDAPRGVESAALWLGLSHLTLLTVLGGRSDWVDEALWLLMVFGLVTLVAERLIAGRSEERRTVDLDPFGLAALIVLPTLSVMGVISQSTTLGTSSTTAGWSVLGGSMMAAGFGLRSAIHRRVALAVLAVCILRVFLVDTVGLSDTARIAAFLVLGLILVGIAFLYARFTEQLKSWL